MYLKMHQDTVVGLPTCPLLRHLECRLLNYSSLMALSWLASAEPTLDDIGDERLIGWFLFAKRHSMISDIVSRLWFHALWKCQLLPYARKSL
jgi:hypothetical protein